VFRTWAPLSIKALGPVRAEIHRNAVKLEHGGLHRLHSPPLTTRLLRMQLMEMRREGIGGGERESCDAETHTKKSLLLSLAWIQIYRILIVGLRRRVLNIVDARCLSSSPQTCFLRCCRSLQV